MKWQNKPPDYLTININSIATTTKERLKAQVTGPR
jgi:hypothetical protein